MEEIRRSSWTLLSDVLNDGLPAVRDLVADKQDLALVFGPSLDPDPNVRQRDRIRQTLADGNCPFTVTGWLVVCVAVHPTRPLREIDEATIRGLLSKKVRSWKEIGGGDGSVRLILSQKAGLTYRQMGWRGRWGDETNSIDAATKALAADSNAIGFLCADVRLLGSGLRLLPVKPAGSTEALWPTEQNVTSGRYPLYAYALVATRPSPSPAAAASAAWLSARWGSGSWSMRTDFTLPTEPNEVVWPAPDARTPAPGISVSVAVMPTVPENPYFVMADESHYAYYEQAVYDGIGTLKGTKVVDRAEMMKVIQERILAMTTESEPTPGPIIAADVLIATRLIAEQSRAVLVIQAVHPGTATCVGEIRLPVDGVHPAGFSPALDKRVAQWWPGVVQSLPAALAKPIWTVLPAHGRTPAENELLRRFLGAIRNSLGADERVFLADYAKLSEGQRELVMALAGISRPIGAEVTPASDYLIGCQPGAGGRLEIHVYRGSDLRSVASLPVEKDSSVDPSAWVRRLAGSLGKARSQTASAPSPSTGTAAADQARMCLEEANRLVQQRNNVRGRLVDLQRKGEPVDEAQNELDQIDACISSCFLRATQLDPFNEQAAYAIATQSVLTAVNGPAYILSAEKVRRILHYVATFPKGKHRREMMEDLIRLYTGLARNLERSRSISWIGLPQGIPLEKTAREYRLRGLQWKSRYMSEFMPILKGVDPNRIVFNPTQSAVRNSAIGYAGVLLEFLRRSDTTAEDMEKAVGEYARHADAYPQIMDHADFPRLEYWANKGNKEAYVALLGKMQERWPDPGLPQWRTHKDDIMRHLAGFYQKLYKDLAFGQWLNGQRGPGGLP